MTNPQLDLGPPPKEVITRIKNVYNRCDEETQKLIDDLYSYWEVVSTDLFVFNLRLQKQWTEGSNLYAQKEVDALVEAEYSIGYDNGYEKARQEEKDFIAGCLA